MQVGLRVSVSLTLTYKSTPDWFDIGQNNVDLDVHEVLIRNLLRMASVQRSFEALALAVPQWVTFLL